MSTTLAAPPLQTPLVENPRDGLISKVWGTWLRSLIDRAQVAAFAIVRQTFASQSASLPLQSLVPLASGLYRVSYRFRLTTAGGVSSSFQVLFTTTEGGVLCTVGDAAYTGNVTNIPQSGSFIVSVDPSTPLQVFTIYASTGAPAMVCDLIVLVEQL
jgi:hypothetical protein